MRDRFNRLNPHAAGRAYPRAVAVGAVAIAVAALAGACGGGHRTGTAPAAGLTAPAGGPLPQATTYTTLKGLPEDAATPADGGTVVHPTTAVAVSATPGGPPVAVLPSTELGGPTWVPVVDSKPGWRRVLLPSRPNRVAGWISAGDALRTARSPYTIQVDLSARRLTLRESGRELGRWTVAVGAPKTPTPTGRTFILALLAPTKPTYSPLILPLGVHSDSLDTYGGGPGTVAFHGWPSTSVFGKAITHGCVRVPSDALHRLSSVPLGTVVDITA